MGLTMSPGSRLGVTIADPFEISQYIEAEVVAVAPFASGADIERVLVRLSQPIIWRGLQYEHVVLEPRHSPGLFDELGLTQAIDCNGMGINAEDAGLAPPWGVTNWRGGLAMIATVRVLSA